MTASSPTGQQLAPGEAMRAHLTGLLEEQLDGLVSLVGQKLSDLMNEAAPSRVLQIRQDAWFVFNKAKGPWRAAILQGWQDSLKPQNVPTTTSQRGKLELIETGTIENKIIASRMALAVTEEAAVQVKELRKRFMALNRGEDLPEGDIVHPENQVLAILQAWTSAGMSKEAWDLVADAVRRFLIQKLPVIYEQCNDELQALGVMPVVEASLKIGRAHV